MTVRYLAFLPVEGSDVLSIADMLFTANKQQQRNTQRGGSLSASALELADIPHVGLCWAVRAPATPPPVTTVRTAPTPVPTPANIAQRAPLTATARIR